MVRCVSLLGRRGWGRYALVEWATDIYINAPLISMPNGGDWLPNFIVLLFGLPKRVPAKGHHKFSSSRWSFFFFSDF